MSLQEKAFDKALFIFNGYLEGKDYMPVIRKIINPLFTLILSSYFYERYFFSYDWLNLTDYKAILDFIIKGKFIIPASIFLIIHVITSIFSLIVLSCFNWPVIRFMRKYNLKTGDKTEMYKLLKQVEISRKMEPIEISYKDKIEVQNTFYLICKSIIVSIFYFCIEPRYSIALFLATLICLITMLILFWVLYLALNYFLPAIANLKAEVINSNLKKEPIATVIDSADKM